MDTRIRPLQVTNNQHSFVSLIFICLHRRYYQITNDFTIKTKESDLNFPEHLNVYCFEPHNFTKFNSPALGTTGVLNYYILDGGSLLPVLALDLKPGNKMLDMCAAPGGKSILAIQTLYPDCVVSNDVAFTRVNRVSSVFKEYLYDLKERWLETGRLRISHNDGRSITENDFDRILVGKNLPAYPDLNKKFFSTLGGCTLHNRPTFIERERQ